MVLHNLEAGSSHTESNVGTLHWLLRCSLIQMVQFGFGRIDTVNSERVTVYYAQLKSTNVCRQDDCHFCQVPKHAWQLREDGIRRSHVPVQISEGRRKAGAGNLMGQRTQTIRYRRTRRIQGTRGTS